MDIKQKLDYSLLEKLIEIPGASSDESKIKDFVLNYVLENQHSWKSRPRIYCGEELQDQLILVFGQPKTAVFAHLDTVGFSVGYRDELIRIGGPAMQDAVQLIGEDSNGKISAELSLFQDESGRSYPHFVADRPVDRGTILTYQPNFKETKLGIESPYLDNRLGVFIALKLAESIENGALVFSTYEEHGGNSVAFCANFLEQKYKIRQALICDVTWATEGVKQGQGVAVSMRDYGLPRRSYLNRILELATKSGIKFQLEVESDGSSDGGMLQKSSSLWDWCFIGAPEMNMHTPNEKVMYSYLLKWL